ncbi:MAG: M48 family metalloprotease [Pseudomonadota bacterium]
MTNRRSLIRRWITLLAVVGGLAGCVVNPVTGKRELAIVTAQQEVQLGTQNYLPMQQSQGGVFRLDATVNDYVRRVGNRVAAVSDRDLPYEFVVLNNSVPNAWALPGGKIAINRGLLHQMQSESELAAVLGHEVVHAAARHSAQQMQRGMLLQVLVLGTAVVTSDSDYGQLATGAANVGAQLLSQSYGRRAELESDLYGMRYMHAAGYDPEGAVDLQETFLRLAQERGRTGAEFDLFASHPPTQQRLATNRITAAELTAGQSGGMIGRDEFARAMVVLRETKPAFDAYDEGRKALAAKDFSAARRFANKAIRLEPREASFYALLGDAEFLQEDYADAQRHYTDALDRDATFFYYHLQRGITRQRSGAIDAAVVDLTNSLRLFETAPAHYALGQIAKQRGQRDAALAHFERAGTGSGEMAIAAQTEMMQIDLGSNPEKYLQVRGGTDGQGQLLVQIANPTAVPVRGLQINIRYLDSNGQVRSLSRTLNGTLAAGQSTTAATGLGPFQDPSQFEVRLTAAQIAR